MKKFLFLGIGSALMFTMGGVGPAQADNSIHTTTAVVGGGSANMKQAGGERCAGCHRAHTAKAANLLKEAQPALCYSCHGASATGSALDVVDGADRSSSKALRGGGFEFALIDGTGANKTMGNVPGAHGLPAVVQNVPVLGASVPPTATTSNHVINGTAGTMWGNGAISDPVANAGKASVTLECGSCHDPHGNGNYRILRPIPNDAGPQLADLLIPAVAASATGVTPVVLAQAAVYRSITGVNIPDATAKNYTTTNYWDVTDRTVPTVHAAAAFVDPTGAAIPAVVPPALGQSETDGYVANIAAWCTTCHTRYYAPSGSAGVYSGDTAFSYRHASNRSDKAGVSRPNCIQCHVSHGSNVKMIGYAATDVGMPGGTLDAKGNATAPSADSRLLRVDSRGTCVMCHNV